MQESILFVCFHVEKRDWLSGFFFHRTVARSRLRHAVIAVKPHEAAAISLSGLTSCCRVRCSLSGGVWSPVRSMRWEPGVPSAPRSRPGSGLEAICYCRYEETVCGTDNVTYDSQCQLTAAISIKNTPIAVARNGPCNAGTAAVVAFASEIELMNDSW